MTGAQRDGSSAGPPVPVGSPGPNDEVLQPTGAPPRMTVVIAAHTRTEYLRRAVSSATSQGAEEVLVVKFAHDPELDAELMALGARVHVSAERFQGGKVAEAIGIATGEAVVLLDDDDVLLEGRVAHMREIFRDPRVVFASNGYRPFTDTPPPPGPSRPVRLFKTGEVDQLRRGLKPMLTSCISVRRSMILPWLDDLRRLVIADHTMFIMAVIARRWMAMDPTALTGYHLGAYGTDLRPKQSIWRGSGANARGDIAWMLDQLDAQTGAVHDTLTPVVAKAVVHLVFLTADPAFGNYRREMRALLDGVGIRRPLTVPTTLMFLYGFAPRLAVRLNNIWRSLVGFHHNQG